MGPSLLLAGLLWWVLAAGASALTTTTLVRGLDHPWSVAFLPGDGALITERSGTLRLYRPGKNPLAAIAGVPAVLTGNQAGLFDVVLDPQYADNHRLYLSYAEGSADANGVAVASATLDSARTALGDVKVIFRQTPKADSRAHYGGRLVFARDGTLFVTLGERQSHEERVKAQRLDTDHGKVARINRDGSIPADNPFLKQAGARAEIWSYGHRNPQGAALHPVTGELWMSEHGPQGGDEINIVRAGKNYGWPVITWGCEYVICTRIGEGRQKAGMEQPLTYWVPKSIAPSGLAFYTGNRYPAWKGNLFSGALAGEALWRLVLDGDKVVSREKLLDELGERIRDVRQGPDGLLYLLTDSDDGRLLRIEPPATR